MTWKEFALKYKVWSWNPFVSDEEAEELIRLLPDEIVYELFVRPYFLVIQSVE